MNLQHNLALLIAKQLSQKEDSDEEKALLVYGIEVFLNEFFKLVCAWIIALLIGKLLEVMLIPALLASCIHLEVGVLIILNVFICGFLVIYTPLSQKNIRNRYGKYNKKINYFIQKSEIIKM